MEVIEPNKYIYVATRDSSFMIRNSRVFITDSIGNTFREKIFRTPFTLGYIWLHSILPQANGDFVFGGFSELTNNDSTDVFLTRTDSLLNVPPIGINQNFNQIPKKYKLYPVYPNPFNPVTNIKYEIPKDVNVAIKIYDILGKEVFSFNEYKKAGNYEVQFDGTNFASGMYFYQIVAEEFTDTKKMVLLK
jgi:hypothetical protein